MVSRREKPSFVPTSSWNKATIIKHFHYYRLSWSLYNSLWYDRRWSDMEGRCEGVLEVVTGGSLLLSWLKHPLIWDLINTGEVQLRGGRGGLFDLNIEMNVVSAGVLLPTMGWAQTCRCGTSEETTAVSFIRFNTSTTLVQAAPTPRTLPPSHPSTWPWDMVGDSAS